ncbi:hypothetical protein BESB_026680 [Besnoitia besnoiti]|uniref:Microneme protein MIC11 n=1 Tax=Besnoitia besnoiti TaxID=94643 RepID=A0A2A9M397_BESBE|nr:uncharacterized protein BESB_026680 [Besnoitia besnoiti]PFH31694.1 hypothetical protein BESB_026680 [Besnoitia besnoiti]
MARKILGLVAALGAVGTASAVLPGGSNHSIPAARDTQIAMVEIRMRNRLAEMTTEMHMVKNLVTGFGKDLLGSIAPVVEDACQNLAKEVAGLQTGEDEEELDMNFTQVSSNSLKSIAPHTGKEGVSFAETEFFDNMKQSLKKAASKVKQVASPMLEKLKVNVMATVKKLLNEKIAPLLRQKASTLITNVCEKAKEKVGEITGEE